MRDMSKGYSVTVLTGRVSVRSGASGLGSCPPQYTTPLSNDLAAAFDLPHNLLKLTAMMIKMNHSMATGIQNEQSRQTQ